MFSAHHRRQWSAPCWSNQAKTPGRAWPHCGSVQRIRCGMSSGDCYKWPRRNFGQQIRQKASINFGRPPQRGPRSVTKSRPIDGQRCEPRSQTLLQRPHLGSKSKLAMGPRRITEAPAMQCLFNASMRGFLKALRSPADRRAPLLSQTETANPRGNVDTENPNETLYVYHPRRGSLWCIPTLGHCNHRIRGPDIPPRGHQRTLSRYPHWNYWSGN